MMKPIDKQVLETMQKLDQPYSRSYWDQALLHIEKREKRRRRILGFWWTLAGVILISASSLVWWSSIENKRTPESSTANQLAGITQMEHSGINVKEDGYIDSKKANEDKLLPQENPVSNRIKIANKNNHNSGEQGILIQKREGFGAEIPNIKSGSVIINPALLEPQSETIKKSEALLSVEDEVSLLSTLSISPLHNGFMWKFEKRELQRSAIVLPIKWQFNLLSELSVLTNIPGRKDEKAILGSQVGIGMRLNAGTGFFTGITAGYAIRTGTFGNMLDHPTPEYVFEKKEEGFRLIPTSLSYVHSQLYAGWESGRWSGRAGIQGMYLIGASGELYQYSNEESVENPGVIISRVSKVSEGSISTPAFREWVFELQAGLEFAISPKWRIIGQFAYTPSGLTHPIVENIYDPISGKYESSPGESILKEQFLHIQLGIQYKW